MIQAAEKDQYKTGGDDLDDGLELDPDFLAASDEEGDSDNDGDVIQDGERNLAPLEGEEDEILRSPIAEGKKRKIEETEVAEANEDDDGDEEAKKADKKRRKKEKEKERKAKKRQSKSGISDDTIPTHLSTDDLSNILLVSIKESYPSASQVELDDIVIPQENLLPPPNYSLKKSDDPFAPLQERIESILKPLEKKKIVIGQPQIIILALSGLRCADVVRGVRDVKGNGEVAKLFAKHFKLADQIKYLQQKKVSIAVGTPARVGKLLTEGAIKITSDTVLLLDIGHQDSKTRTILNLPEVRDELWKSVFAGQSRKTLLSGGIRIGAF
ncbi:uncharacterized protein I303_103011 [Kwoniella dejecticola CBS 10117]|uniref:Protein CMS1 n=1 Tax=Kwoniella dejecticola CBS 10117 TaxID=1296121 RepID=A0A1A6AAC5_9TREE|nr:protein CMS1 [Kwoniella dejecticola CBS 10117]OBR87008.1 protein CMS1 [Kwoniella dejecticola CBS 10117]